MKIRWTESGVRFRITPGELTALLAGELVEETLRVTEAPVWRAQILPSALQTGLHQDGAALQIRLSDEDTARLAAPEVEGVYFESEGTPPLRYYIEKDFPCVHPRPSEAVEPKTETFAPPLDFADRKAS